MRGDISVPLLHSIFDYHSPGHDGGVIVDGDRIEKLGVHLPLARNLEAVGRPGTRHAAALGLAQRSDALIFCTSEETGEISYAQSGQFVVLKSAEELHDKLVEFFSVLYPLKMESTALWGFRHLGTQLASASLAVLFWLIFAHSRSNGAADFRCTN